MLKLPLKDIGLKASDVERIHQILCSHPEIKKAILFGSRAKGNFKPSSDIDLTLIGSELNLTIQQKIEGELDDLLLPYKFDLSIFHQIQNVEFLEHIRRVGKDFFVA